MKHTPPNTLKDLEENFFLSGKEIEDALRWSPPNIEYISKRWNHLKKEEALSDMDQILRFSQRSEFSPPKSNSIYIEMRILLFELQEKKWWRFYSRVITIIEKYLQGIKKFLSGLEIQEIQEIHFYKKLFEWTMIAIIEEVKTWEEIHSVRAFG